MAATDRGTATAPFQPKNSGHRCLDGDETRNMNSFFFSVFASSATFNQVTIFFLYLYSSLHSSNCHEPVNMPFHLTQTTLLNKN